MSTSVSLRSLSLLTLVIIVLASVPAIPAQYIPGSDTPIQPEITSSKDAVFSVHLPLVSSRFNQGPEAEGWPTVGANAQRTSWVSEEVRGNLNPEWFKPFESYILPRVQLVTAHGNIYVSTADGLYAIDAQTGNEVWVYPTEMPLGHSPTIVDGVAYVAGFDGMLHAVNARDGSPLWTFAAGAGFDTNPLVIDGKAYLGNRDSYFYAVYVTGPDTGQLAWKYQTGGPIHFSAAYADGVVYFASNDSHAYALSASNGSLMWKSEKLPGAGFHSYWPVIYRDWVVFPGSNNYRFAVEPGAGPIHHLEQADMYPNREADPRGTYVGPAGEEPGDWVPGTPTLDLSQPNVTPNGKTTAVTEYFETKPWRRTYFVLNRVSGQEYSTDFDGDGKREYAPVLWFGSDGAGNRYPPLVASDGVLYQTNNYMSEAGIPGGGVTGWKVGTPFISLAELGWSAIDEPLAYSGGGNLIYVAKCCDRIGKALDISIPAGEKNREWKYFSYDLPERIPGYNIMTYVWDPYYKPMGGVYGGRNGSYGWHGDGNPLVPYNGKVYMHGSNAVIAFSPEAGQPRGLPAAKKPTSNGPMPAVGQVGEAQLRAMLAGEVQKMLAAGHLRPGYLNTGHFDQRSRIQCGDELGDYWHSPGDTLVTLLQALPYLPADLQGQTKDYLQAEFAAYPPHEYNHMGWKDGAAREVFDLPPEVETARSGYSPKKANTLFQGWNFAPNSFYALWKYAEAFGGAKAIFDASHEQLESPPPNNYLADMPHVHNAYIAGFMGYLELENLAGYPETASVRSELERLLTLRVSTFSKDAPDSYLKDSNLQYCRALNASRNFMYLTPELAEYLRNNARDAVQAALDEYYRTAPFWFVSKAEVALGEDVLNHSYDYHAIFQAKAYILQEPRDEIVQYLDIPAMPVGDLFYMQNLVAALGARVRRASTSCGQYY